MRLIDANVLSESVCFVISNSKELVTSSVVRKAVLSLIDRHPTIDAVPVVRCKDCKWYKEGEHLAPNRFCFRLKDANGKHIGYNFSDNDYCSYGERKGDDGHDTAHDDSAV